MTPKDVDIKTEDGLCDAYFTCPDGGGSHPGVLLCMDGFGIRPYLREMADSLAARGYAVLLPNLLYRVKRSPVVDLKFPLRPEDMPEAVRQIMPFFKTFSPEEAMRDMDALVRFLDGEERVRKGPMGLSGYCMGGGVAIRAAARHPGRFAAVASFHGGNLATESPDSPHTLLPGLKAEVYVAHADQDQSAPPEQMERLRRALESSGLRFEAELYRGAGHGFTMADLPAGNPDALERHWSKLADLLKRNLGSEAA